MTASRLRVAYAFTVVAVTLALARPTPAAILVTSCGQSVHGTGILAGDLDCSAAPGPGIWLDKGSRLRLNGHTLTGDDPAVRCSSSCRLLGPGTIRRPAYGGSAHGAFVVDDVVVRNVTFENWAYAVLAFRKAKVRDATFTDGAFGVTAYSSVVKRSSFTGHNTMAVAPVWTIVDGQIVGGKHVIRDSTFADNVIDICTAGVPPVVRRTVCTTSYDVANPSEEIGDQWGVCP